MVYYSVNKAINDKKVSLQYKIHQEYMYIQVVLYLFSRLQSWHSKFHYWKWTTNFKGSILFSLDKFQWNKKAHFQGQYRCLFLWLIANEELYKTNHLSEN